MDIYSDGGARGNPGPAASAFVVIDKIGKVFYQESKFLGITTNNQAEYQGVVLALNWLLSNELTRQSINFYMDSELVVKQLNGLYKVKDRGLLKFFLTVKNLITKIDARIIFQHIPRFKNRLADLLVNEEMDKHQKS